MDAAKNKKAGARSAKKKKGLAYEIRKALKIGKSDYYDFNLVAVIILINMLVSILAMLIH